MSWLLARSFFRFVLRAPFSSLSVLLGVLLGVTSITGVHLLGSQMNATLDRLTPPHLRMATHIASQENATVVGYAALVDLAHRGELGAVNRLVPVVEGTTPDGVRVVATDWLAGAGIADDVAVVAEGDFDLQSVMVQGFDVQPGGTVRVSGRELRVAGVVSTRSELTGGEPTVFADLGIGTELLGRSPDRLDAVLLQVSDPRQRLRSVLEDLMPGMSAGISLETLNLASPWRVHDVQTEVPGFGLARAVLFNVGALGSLSLLVALLLMYQTCVIWLRRQRDTLSRLLDIGVPETALVLGFLGALAAIGALATVLGLLCGRALAMFLLSEVGGLDASSFALDATVIFKAVAAGLGVSLVGGWVAWQMEWRPQARPPTLRAWLVVISVLVGASITLRYSDGLVGAFSVILIVAGLVCWISLPVLAWFRRLADRVRGSMLRRLALREATWYAGDLALAVAALALALGVSIGVGLMVSSFRAQWLDLLELRLSADVFVTAEAGLSEDVAWLSSVPGVRSVATYSDARLRVLGHPLDVRVATFDEAESLRYNFPRALARGEALVTERTLKDFGAELGAPLAVGGGTIRVVGTYPGFGEPGRRMLVGRETARDIGVTGRDTRASLKVADVEAVEAQLRAERPAWQLQNQRSVRENAIAIFDQTFVITEALTMLALVIAAVALFNALGGLRLNQQATSELLDVLGLNRGERLSIDLNRAAAVGGVALLLAVPLGLWLGWVLCAEVNPRAFGWQIELVLSAQPFVVPLTAGGLAVLIAGFLGVPAESRGRIT